MAYNSRRKTNFIDIAKILPQMFQHKNLTSNDKLIIIEIKKIYIFVLCGGLLDLLLAVALFT